MFREGSVRREDVQRGWEYEKGDVQRGWECEKGGCSEGVGV